MKKYSSETSGKSRQLTQNPIKKPTLLENIRNVLFLFVVSALTISLILILDRIWIILDSNRSLWFLVVCIMVVIRMILGWTSQRQNEHTDSNSKKHDYSPDTLEELFHNPTPIARDAALEVLDKLRQFNLLEKGILRTIKLSGLDLHGVDLSFIDVKDGQVEGVNLANATLSFSKLEGANLQYSDLRGADLRHALLLGTNLQGVLFDEATILPDETLWTPHTDMRRFTERTHPQFWIPSWYSNELEDESWFNYQNQIQ